VPPEVIFEIFCHPGKCKASVVSVCNSFHHQQQLSCFGGFTTQHAAHLTFCAPLLAQRHQFVESCLKLVLPICRSRFMSGRGAAGATDSGMPCIEQLCSERILLVPLPASVAEQLDSKLMCPA
jgi:hypothetical protein